MTWVSPKSMEFVFDRFVTTSIKVDYLRADDRLQNASICNLSFPGATAEDDLEGQIDRYFETYPAKNTPDSQPSLDATTSCYSTCSITCVGELSIDFDD